MSPTSRRTTRGLAGEMQDSQSKSGYAVDKGIAIDPEEAAGLAVPRASSRFGPQVGRVTPANRDYTVAAGKRQKVSASEAASRLAARSAGRLAPIEGGLDQQVAKGDSMVEEDDGVEEIVGMLPAGEMETVAPAVGSGYDPLGGDDADAQFDAADEEVARLKDERQRRYDKTAAPILPPPTAVAANCEDVFAPPRAEAPCSSEADAYLAKRVPVMVELEAGMFPMQAIAVIPTPYSVTILLPYANGNGTFIPNPGTELNIVSGESHWHCFFPGAQFTIPELNVLGLTFVRADDG